MDLRLPRRLNSVILESQQSYCAPVTYGVPHGSVLDPLLLLIYTVFQKSDGKIQITITTAHLIRIKYPLSGFNYHLSDVNVANFNKIHRTLSKQQLF